ncbi:hypothetical protein BDW02DRAFT_566491 [Decorospora gaudefroyi]|uniref:Uncharacterized protein n=1 Tax=Decorospora gaudefroyi TaxID=184978 RepID=A0A6A5KIU6_9PLEO|nr:hypothetical protein BDW02DRAFT_566491 [Decorospora gaudefroyi]
MYLYDSSSIRYSSLGCPRYVLAPDRWSLSLGVTYGKSLVFLSVAQSERLSYGSCTRRQRNHVVKHNNEYHHLPISVSRHLIRVHSYGPSNDHYFPSRDPTTHYSTLDTVPTTERSRRPNLPTITQPPSQAKPKKQQQVTTTSFQSSKSKKSGTLVQQASGTGDK